MSLNAVGKKLPFELAVVASNRRVGAPLVVQNQHVTAFASSISTPSLQSLPNNSSGRGAVLLEGSRHTDTSSVKQSVSYNRMNKFGSRKATERLFSCQNRNKAFSDKMLSSSYQFWRTNGARSNISVASLNNICSGQRSMSTMPWREDMIFRDSRLSFEASIDGLNSDEDSGYLQDNKKDKSAFFSTATSSCSLTEDDPRRAFSDNMLANSYHYWRTSTNVMGTQSVKFAVKPSLPLKEDGSIQQ